MGSGALESLLVGERSAALADRLRRRGHEVTLAGELDPIEALQRVEGADLLLSDAELAVAICEAWRARGETTLLVVAVGDLDEGPGLQHAVADERLDELLLLDDPALELRLGLLERRALERRRFAACVAGLTATTEQYRVLFEEASDAIVVTDGEGRIVEVNPAGCALVGYTGEELLGRPVRELLAGEEQGNVPALVEELARRGYLRVEQTLVRKEGSGVLLETMTSALSDGRLLGTARDVSERRRAEQALRESEEIFRRLIEAAFDGVAIHEQGMILEVNEPLARMFGYEPREMIGMSTLDLAAPESRELVRQSVVAGREQPYEAMGLRRDGTKFHGELCGKAVTWRGKKARVVAVRDISERKRAEQSLRQLAALRQAVTSKIIGAQEQERQRLARELHDVVGQMLAVLKMQIDWISGRADHAADVRLAADQLTAKLDETLLVVRELAHGLRPPVLDDLGVSCALETLAQETVQRSGIRCEVEIAEVAGVPAPVGTALYRIAQEALANCLRHSGAQGLRLALEHDEAAGLLVLTVEDDGRGIAAEERDSPHSLGIASMRERAELLGGEIAVERRASGGTRVRVQIPLPEVA
jgi:PAS domain S-box-containing protein